MKSPTVTPTRRAILALALAAAPLMAKGAVEKDAQLDEDIFAALQELQIIRARYDAACEDLARVEDVYYSDPVIAAAAAPVEWRGRTFVDLDAFDTQTSLFSDNPKVVELRRILVARVEIFESRDRHYGLSAAQAAVDRDIELITIVEDRILDMTPTGARGAFALLRVVAATLSADSISLGESGDSMAFRAICRALAVLDPCHVETCEVEA